MNEVPVVAWFPASPRLPLVRVFRRQHVLLDGSWQILLQGGHCCHFAARNPGLHPPLCFLDHSFSYWARVAGPAFV